MDELIDQYINGQKTNSNANIELTFRCPLQCSQCMRRVTTLAKNPNHKKYHVYETFKNKVNESFDIELENLRKLLDFFDDDISFCGQFSDPIYHSKFFDVLDICTKEYPNKKFKIHTSAHQKNIEWYKESFTRSGKNVRWIFGLDGLPDTSFIYRQNQKSQLVYDAMILASNMNIDVVWQYIVFGYNEHQIEEAREIAKKHNIMLKLVFTDRKSKDIKQASERYRPKGNIKENKVIT